MSQLVIDLLADLKAQKAEEHIIAHAPLQLIIDTSLPPLSGIVKIASKTRADGSGYITATFLVDYCDDQVACENVELLFGLLNKSGFKPKFGSDFQYLTPFETIMDDRGQWFMGDMNFYFKHLAGNEKDKVERLLLPGLGQHLPIRFDAVEWWI